MTLDCRIVDLDSIQSHQEKPDVELLGSRVTQARVSLEREVQKKYLDDYEDALASLMTFSGGIENAFQLSPFSLSELKEIFQNSYFATLRGAEPPPLPDSSKSTPTETHR